MVTNNNTNITYIIPLNKILKKIALQKNKDLFIQKDQNTLIINNKYLINFSLSLYLEETYILSNIVSILKINPGLIDPEWILKLEDNEGGFCHLKATQPTLKATYYSLNILKNQLK